MKNKKHIFFDLDHTLWDFEKNSTEAIFDLFDFFKLNDKIPDFNKFIEDYQQINKAYWHQYNLGEIDKKKVRYHRFIDIFKLYQLENHLDFAHTFADAYIDLAPTKKNVFDDAHDVLDYLKTKFKLHIITNGFKEIQATKLSTTNLDKYFDLILCSEEIGVNKPHPNVFNAALYKTGAVQNESVMIGDSFQADILGAHGVGIDAIFFNPKKEKIDLKIPEKSPELLEIHTLSELIKIF